MLIPIEWLREYVALPDDLQELADRLTQTGNEIEGVRNSDIGPVLELKLTPNRGDMLSLQGVAREVAALYDLSARIQPPAAPTPGPSLDGVAVRVDAPDLCLRYAALLLKGVRVGPSPEWLVRRLEAAGLRSICNVVDVTNYVMLETGQPLHAFDLELLRGRAIIVRRAAEGERLLTIDGTEVDLSPEMLVIADAERPVALAGVMGGQETEVHDGTANVLLESACFDAVSVRRTARRTAVASAASYRFERGVDPNGVLVAATRAAALIVQLAGGGVCGTQFDVYPCPIQPRTVPFRPARCRALLGCDPTESEMRDYFRRLGLNVAESSAEQWNVSCPTSRTDLAIEEDLIEEVGRMFGYDRLPETLPGGASGAGARSDIDRLWMRTRELMTGFGLNEAVCSTLISSRFLHSSGLAESPAWRGGSLLPIRNALSVEFDALRPSLLPGLLMACSHNSRRGCRNIYLFECGIGHRRSADDAPESRHLIGGVMLGGRGEGDWNQPLAAADFYAAKGAVEAYVAALGRRVEAVSALAHPALHPGRAALLQVGGSTIAGVGELHPAIADALDLPRGVVLFEIDADALLAMGAVVPHYEPPSRFPHVVRDLATVLENHVPAVAVEHALRQTLGSCVKSIRLIDVYEGKPIPEGKASLTFSLELGLDDRTLVDAEVEGLLDRARTRLVDDLGASFRS